MFKNENSKIEMKLLQDTSLNKLDLNSTDILTAIEDKKVKKIL